MLNRSLATLGRAGANGHLGADRGGMSGQGSFVPIRARSPGYRSGDFASEGAKRGQTSRSECLLVRAENQTRLGTKFVRMFDFDLKFGTSDLGPGDREFESRPPDQIPIQSRRRDRHDQRDRPHLARMPRTSWRDWARSGCSCYARPIGLPPSSPVPAPMAQMVTPMAVT
jgi:hypothetical protein